MINHQVILNLIQSLQFYNLQSTDPSPPPPPKFVRSHAKQCSLQPLLWPAVGGGEYASKYKFYILRILNLEIFQGLPMLFKLVYFAVFITFL